jgi:hypothetical protein
MNKLLLLVIASIISGQALSDSAKCTIEIEDINASALNKMSSKYEVIHIFDYLANANPLTSTQPKFFELPDKKYMCAIRFVTSDMGSSLSCELKGSNGQIYVQSDNTSSLNTNFLAFRDKLSHYTIKATCKKA